MSIESNNKDFSQYCREMATWLIKYSSENVVNPVYFIWYNDPKAEGRNKLLTFIDGTIFATDSLSNFVAYGFNGIDSLLVHDNINQFMLSLKDFSTYTITSFELATVMQKVDQNILDADTLSWITDFLYLAEDYTNSNPNSIQLNDLLTNPILQSTILFYNENILWPSLSKANSAVPVVNPIFDIDHIILAKQLRKVVSLFDNSINFDGIAT